MYVYQREAKVHLAGISTSVTSCKEETRRTFNCGPHGNIGNREHVADNVGAGGNIRVELFNLLQNVLPVRNDTGNEPTS